ncbi:hypothetical protein [Marinibacterium profundimaris]|uniref:Response regulatory domain-containing protein n=1 Tax=Marinibacterium profundimaris TaxID=1679460 RepID=A0A225NDC7_9RHOB|nr:hypothetical protein [Marinibacterium profundimaris]OWU69880.1 hypothetical protein ATO3_21680 [Marinibacterium profundimaris]
MQILVICGDPVLALDLELFLSGNGYLPVMTECGAMHLPGPADLGDCASAIVNIDRFDDDTRAVLERLSASQIPIIAVSSLEEEDLTGVPPVVAWHAKPLSVDYLLPDVRSATAGRLARDAAPEAR